jgi:predicted amidohydrolase YtcJ
LATDTTLIRREIYTANPNSHWAYAIEGAHIEAMGSGEAILNRCTTNKKVIDTSRRQPPILGWLPQEIPSAAVG